jgi:gluconate 2-dehydrogenase gamma chain
LTARETLHDTSPHRPHDDGAATKAAQRVSRRHFLVVSAASGATAALTSSAAHAQQPPAAPSAPAVTDPHAGHGGMQMAQVQPGMPSVGAAGSPLADGFLYFSPFQARIVNAAAGRLIPTDENGPGAIEAGVVTFIDRQLASNYGFTGRRYSFGPFANGTPTQGDQSGLDMRDRYRLGIQGMEDYAQQLYQRGFADLASDQQDRVLADMQAGIPTTFDGSSIQAATTVPAGGSTEAMHQMALGAVGIGAAAFFQLLLSHVIAGFFADPVYGGNRNMIGWKLIGFPGAQASYTAWIGRYGVPFDGPFVSLAAYQENFTKGS